MGHKVWGALPRAAGTVPSRNPGFGGIDLRSPANTLRDKGSRAADCSGPRFGGLDTKGLTGSQTGAGVVPMTTHRQGVILHRHIPESRVRWRIDYGPNDNGGNRHSTLDRVAPAASAHTHHRFLRRLDLAAGQEAPGASRDDCPAAPGRSEPPAARVRPADNLPASGGLHTNLPLAPPAHLHDQPPCG